MAWIESHQELRDHPKVARLGRLLDVHRTSAIGMLHLLWWWALDHAEDGDVTDFDAMDLALAADWEGDPEVLVKALLECGPGRREGFLAENEGRLVLHDWWQYAGKLVARRRIDRDRKRESRTPPDQGVQWTSNRHVADGSETAYVTEPNPTEQNQPTPSSPAPPSEERRPDVDQLCDLLAELVAGNGCRRPTVSKGWRTEARLLLDRDGVDQETAERVMRWALADPFWKSNVLSMPKFRAKFDQLKLKVDQPTKRSNGAAARYAEVRTNFKKSHA